MDSFRTLTALWPWLTPLLPIATALSVIGRRRGWHPWSALVGVFRLEMALEECRQALAASEASRQSEIKLRQAATAALEEMVRVGQLIRAATEKNEPASRS